MGLMALITLHIVCPSTFVTSLIRDILHSWRIEKTRFKHLRHDWIILDRHKAAEIPLSRIFLTKKTQKHGLFVADDPEWTILLESQQVGLLKPSKDTTWKRLWENAFDKRLRFISAYGQVWLVQKQPGQKISWSLYFAVGNGSKLRKGERNVCECK